MVVSVCWRTAFRRRRTSVSQLLPAGAQLCGGAGARPLGAPTSAAVLLEDVETRPVSSQESAAAGRRSGAGASVQPVPQGLLADVDQQHRASRAQQRVAQAARGRLPARELDRLPLSRRRGTRHRVMETGTARYGPVRRVVWGPEANYLRLPDSARSFSEDNGSSGAVIVVSHNRDRNLEEVRVDLLPDASKPIGRAIC